MHLRIIETNLRIFKQCLQHILKTPFVLNLLEGIDCWCLPCCCRCRRRLLTGDATIGTAERLQQLMKTVRNRIKFHDTMTFVLDED